MNARAGLVQYAAMFCNNNMISDITEASRIARIAMGVIERNNSSTDRLSSIFTIYYGFVGMYTEQVQNCTHALSRGKNANE